MRRISRSSSQASPRCSSDGRQENFSEPVLSAENVPRSYKDKNKLEAGLSWREDLSALSNAVKSKLSRSTLRAPLKIDDAEDIEVISSGSEDDIFTNKDSLRDKKDCKQFDDFKAEILSRRTRSEGKKELGSCDQHKQEDSADPDYDHLDPGPQKKKLRTGRGRPAHSKNKTKLKSELELELAEKTKLINELQDKLNKQERKQDDYIPCGDLTLELSKTLKKDNILMKVMSKDISIDQKHIDQILRCLHIGKTVGWDDIQGLAEVKKAVYEACVWPLLRPDLFTGTRSTSKGILMYGPPGTGKSELARCVASSCQSSAFFSITSSSITSKYVGEGEKTVKALFTVARAASPAVIFIDEMEVLLADRSQKKHESGQHIVTEFLNQMEGVTDDDDGTSNVLVIGATNRPFMVDDAVLRRLPTRLYVPLPDVDARRDLLTYFLNKTAHSLNVDDIRKFSVKTVSYSGSDISHLVREASLMPIREMSDDLIRSVSQGDVRPLTAEDVGKAMLKVKPSANKELLSEYAAFTAKYGSV